MRPMTRQEAIMYKASRGEYPSYMMYPEGGGMTQADAIGMQQQPAEVPYIGVATDLLNEYNKKPSQTDRAVQLANIEREHNMRQRGIPIPQEDPGMFAQLAEWLGGGGGATAGGTTAGGTTAGGTTAGSGGILDSIGGFFGGGGGATAGGTTAGGAASGGAAAGGGATASSGMGLGQIGMAGLQYIGGPAAALYGGYKLMDRDKWDDKNEWEHGTRNGAITGAGIGTAIMPGLGTAIGAGLGALGGAVGSLTGGGKSRAQQARDTYRKALKEGGFFEDDKYSLTTESGNKFDFGLDGGKANYNVDFNNANAGNAVGGANPLGFLLGDGLSSKQRTDLTGQLSNYAMSGGDVGNNLKKAYGRVGLDHDSAYGAVHQAFLDGRLDQATADAYKNGLDELYGVGAYKNKPKSPVAQSAQGKPPTADAMFGDAFKKFGGGFSKGNPESGKTFNEHISKLGADPNSARNLMYVVPPGGSTQGALADKLRQAIADRGVAQQSPVKWKQIASSFRKS